MSPPDSIAILDFGSQTTQLIARRIREAHVYSELFPFDAPEETVLRLRPKGFILSGGPASVYEPGAPRIPTYVLTSGLPILGICYGMQAMAHALGGQVAASSDREFGPAVVEVAQANPVLPKGQHPVWMSHGDRIESPPPGFEGIAVSGNSPHAAMIDRQRQWIGLQFHPEVHHTPIGTEILRAFAVEVCGAEPSWTAASIIKTGIEQIRTQVGDGDVLAAVSGGVDSSVAAALVHRAVGDQLTCVFVDTGLMRRGEPEDVVEAFSERLGTRLLAVNASETFLEALAGIMDPEEKRRIVGEKFIRVFEEQARRAGHPRYLVQGTIYPDVVESSGPERRKASRIKTHHNVAGLPEDLDFELVEPLRSLFKDEVRQVGLALGLPETVVWRQPFPGPGLAVRCIGEVTPARLATLREAEAIVGEELSLAGLLRGETAQAFAVLLPVRSVGVMGDQRTYAETVALRAVTTEDFMTADWARLPEAVLARISQRIVNEVGGVNRVVYDITSKPPATIEWE
ncbi:MAG TPA: glutamine-hydrolyzing GMP synthase [Anaerolineales bacterium]|nr:glutamine-hydrolyzing GMP synthase [Anaerolineales bacterium]